MKSLTSHSTHTLTEICFLFFENSIKLWECFFFCYLDPAMFTDPENVTVNVKVGQEVDLLCGGEGYPTPAIILTAIYINGSHRNRLSGDSNLTIAAETSFWFQCTVENYLAKRIKWFHLGG